MKVLTAVFLSAFLVVPPPLPAQEPIISAECAILFDANTGRVIYKKNENERRAVASTQKLLTALIIAESGDLSAPVVIDKSDMLATPTKLYVKAGESYTRQQLLTALLIKSPNDVARALARDNAGSVENFALKMNSRMARMGGESSNFVNPNGLPAEDQVLDGARYGAGRPSRLLQSVTARDHADEALHVPVRERQDYRSSEYESGAEDIFVL